MPSVRCCFSCILFFFSGGGGGGGCLVGWLINIFSSTSLSVKVNLVYWEMSEVFMQLRRWDVRLGLLYFPCLIIDMLFGFFFRPQNKWWVFFWGGGGFIWVVIIQDIIIALSDPRTVTWLQSRCLRPSPVFWFPSRAVRCERWRRVRGGFGLSHMLLAGSPRFLAYISWPSRRRVDAPWIFMLCLVPCTRRRTRRLLTFTASTQPRLTGSLLPVRYVSRGFTCCLGKQMAFDLCQWLIPDP